MLDTTTLLDHLPARLHERVIEEAERLTGGPAALYVVDISGTCLRRLCGSAGLPAEVPLINGIGPEIGADGFDEMRAQLESALVGAAVAPLWLRGRATCVLVAANGGIDAEELQRLAEIAAPAVELAPGYTDVFDRARRHRPATAAAEIQQDLLAPRMATVTGGRLAGSLLPAYDVGGDWFDHAENPEGAWLGVADAMGRGSRAAGISAVAIGAFRAARRAGASLEECCAAIDETVSDLHSNTFVTIVLANWHARTRTLTWINCGHPLPLLLTRDGRVTELDGEGTHPLGLWRDQRDGFVRNQLTLEMGDRVLLYSDGITDRRMSDGEFLGIDGLLDALADLREASASQTVIALETMIRSASDAELADDATQLVLEVTG
jgi:serine phosphatase RsbU (regulator of sigma subunit)